MAQQAVDTLIEWSPEDYLTDLIAKSGCKRPDGLAEMGERIKVGRLILIRQRLVDGKPYNPFDRKPYDKEEVDPDHDFYKFSFTSDFRPGYKVRVHVNSDDGFEYRYTVAELPRLPESHTAPTQQLLENKLGPDSFKTGADRPVAAQRPTKAAKLGNRAADRDAAIEARLDNGEIPGRTVQWDSFCHNIRTDCDAIKGDPKKPKFERGFSDGQIMRATRRLMKLRSA
jgi:hypothetical protein